MIKTLYPTFRRWSEKGSVYIISDTHFEDEDCKLMDPNWISPEEQVAILKKYVKKNDTLIHLGDVGNPQWMKEIAGYKVLITGNHDRGVQIYEPFFDEIYNGPLFISDKIILSHEPVAIEFALNIHGHNHNHEWKTDGIHINCACNVVGYTPLNLNSVIKAGYLKNIPSIHRLTIESAKEKKQKKELEEERT